MATASADLPQFKSPESVLNMLRGHGLRVSTARRMVVHTLFAAQGPLSAEQLAAGLNGVPRLDLASVYRNLETLEELGVVQHLRTGYGPGRWTLARAGAGEYLACERCGALEQADPGGLNAAREEIRRRFGFEACFSHFPVVGLCAGCSTSGDEDL
jgi:Fur family transcriptional regulator, ferric uptake regulator